MTTALEVGEGSASRLGRSLSPGKTSYPLYRRLGGHQGRSGQVRKISHSPGFDPRTVQPVASRSADWATRPTLYFMVRNNLFMSFSFHFFFHCPSLSSYYSTFPFICTNASLSACLLIWYTFLNPWFRASWFNVNKKVQLDATVCRHLFTATSLYMFRASQHPPSGVLKTASATSGIGHDTGTATSFHRCLIRPRWKEVAVPASWPIPEVADAVFSTPDDGCCDTRNM